MSDHYPSAMHVPAKDNISMIISDLSIALKKGFNWIIFDPKASIKSWKSITAINSFCRNQERQNKAGVTITFENYLEVRTNYDFQIMVVDLLKPLLKDTKPSNAFFFILAKKALMRYVNALEESNRLIALSLQNLDALPKSKSNIFRHIKEAELWAKRPAGYEYLL